MKKIYSIIALLACVFLMNGQVLVTEDWESVAVDTEQNKNGQEISNGWIHRANGGGGTALSKIISATDKNGALSNMVKVTYADKLTVASNMGLVIPVTLDETKALTISMDVKINTFSKNNGFTMVDGASFSSLQSYFKFLFGRSSDLKNWKGSPNNISLGADTYQTWLSVSRDFTVEEVAGFVTANGNDLVVQIGLGYKASEDVLGVDEYTLDIDVDNIIIEQSIPLSVKGMVESGIKVIRKQGAVEVVNSMDKSGRVAVYSISGSKVAEEPLQSGSNTISLSKGAYVIATTIDGKVSTQKVIM